APPAREVVARPGVVPGQRVVAVAPLGDVADADRGEVRDVRAREGVERRVDVPETGALLLHEHGEDARPLRRGDARAAADEALRPRRRAGRVEAEVEARPVAGEGVALPAEHDVGNGALLEANALHQLLPARLREDLADTARARGFQDVLDVEEPDRLGGNADARVVALRVELRRLDLRRAHRDDVRRARVLLDARLRRRDAPARPPAERRRRDADVAG